MKSGDNKSDFVIVGGVAAGPKTAASLIRRLPKASVTLFQKESRLSYATCGMPYFASGDVNSFDELIQTPWRETRDERFFAEVKGFSAITGAEVIAIDREKKTVKVKIDRESAPREHGYGKLILATGGRPAPPPFPVEQCPQIRFFTRPDDAIHFRRSAEQGKVGTAAVIGGGYIGCEMAEAFGSLWGITTTLIEKEDHVLAATLDPEMSRLVERQLQKQGIDLRTACCVERIARNGEGAAVYFAGGDVLEIDFVFVCVGIIPETTLAQDCGLTIGPAGAIAVDEHFCTSDPDIYAGGDCVELIHRITGKRVYVPLGSLANRHGWVMAENLAGNDVTYPGVLGSFLIKIFDLNVGGTGLNYTEAAGFAQKAATIWGTFADRPEYYPESKTVMLKMIYDEEDGRLLGLQAAGEGEVARRIDVFAAFLQSKASVHDLLHFEHGYAPPYAEAVDPLHHLAGMAQARTRGVRFAGPRDIDDLLSEDAVWLDVREPIEHQDSPLELPGTPELIELPLDRLRENLADLPSGGKIVILCQRGSRAYQAAIFLRDAGFENVVVLGGGRAMLG